MNERIEKLAEQCYETGPIGKDGWPEYSKFNYKKFAELIVRECARVAIKKQTENGMDNIVSKNPAKDFAYALIDHFEIK